MSRRTDPVLLAVLSNAFEGIVREMTTGLLRSARSSVINTARDFSCSILTADNQLLAAAEGAPVHVFGSELLGAAMSELHHDLQRGDAFLHNDPYRGNSHAADHSLLVPIFIGGTHMFTAVAKAHQADCGNSLPTTYDATALDVYDEGALIFPCVRVQKDFTDIEDIMRMCRVRIRVPDQWYGDYLAMVGSARIAERRVEELAERYDAETLRGFVEDWFDYSERLAASALATLPSCTLHGAATHDPFPGTDAAGLELRATIEVDPAAGRVRVDLRDNPDNLRNGLNLTEATATAAALAGVLSGLPHPLPSNAGTFRRFEVQLREGCAVGIPRHPFSCSSGTTNLADRVVGLVQAAFADMGDGYGQAEGATGQAPAKAVISGNDARTGEPYVNQILLGGTGGPASPYVDGWPTFQRPVTGALIYHDSIEIDEQRYPILVRERTLIADSAGDGRTRGAPSTRVVIEPRFDDVSFVYGVESKFNPPRGVRGGHDGAPAEAWIQDVATGTTEEAPEVGRIKLARGQRIVSVTAGGGGYGLPLERDPEAVLRDVVEGIVTEGRAREVYGVILVDGAVDADATAQTRRLAAAHGAS